MAFTTIPNVRLWNALYGKQEFTTGRVWFLLLLSLFLFFFLKKERFMFCLGWVSDRGTSAVIRPLRVPWRFSVRLAPFRLAQCLFCKLPFESWCVFICVPVCYVAPFWAKIWRGKGLERCAVWCKLKNLLFASRSYFSENLKIWRKHVVSLVKYRSMEKTLHIVQIRSVPRPFGCLHVLDGHEENAPSTGAGGEKEQQTNTNRKGVITFCYDFTTKLCKGISQI